MERRIAYAERPSNKDHLLVNTHELLRYDHYKVLGVERDASTQQIKRAYRERVKQCHPDRSTSPNAALVFRAVHDAYDTLMDAERRARYDERLRFYRGAMGSVDYTATKRTAPFARRYHAEEPDRPVHRFAFVGLHLTGFLFGTALVIGIAIGILFLHWPMYTILFSAPGIAVLPDSVAGLRTK